MPTANEKLQEATIDHAVDLQLYANGLVARMIALLNRTDADLAGLIAMAATRAEPSGDGSATISVARLEELLQSVREMNSAAWEAFHGALREELQEFAAVEAGYQAALFEDAIPPQVIAAVSVAPVNAGQVYAAAMSRPFQGRLLREWAESMGEARMERIRDQIRIGFVENESIDTIVRRIRGTRAQKYADGALQIDRRGAEAVVRTAVQHVAAVARENMFEANSDIISAVKWLATLDTRTSEICRLRDGKVYTATAPHKPVGHSVAWLSGPGQSHWNCRSCSLPVLKSWRELGIDMDDEPAATRASMDGQVPDKTTFGEWVKRQSAERQEKILGATRAQLMRSGGLALDQFYNNRGSYLTLDQLREKHAAAFKKAGV